MRAGVGTFCFLAFPIARGQEILQVQNDQHRLDLLRCRPCASAVPAMYAATLDRTGGLLGGRALGAGDATGDGGVCFRGPRSAPSHPGARLTVASCAGRPALGAVVRTLGPVVGFGRTGEAGREGPRLEPVRRLAVPPPPGADEADAVLLEAESPELAVRLEGPLRAACTRRGDAGEAARSKLEFELTELAAPLAARAAGARWGEAVRSRLEPEFVLRAGVRFAAESGDGLAPSPTKRSCATEMGRTRVGFGDGGAWTYD